MRKFRSKFHKKANFVLTEIKSQKKLTKEQESQEHLRQLNDELECLLIEDLSNQQKIEYIVQFIEHKKNVGGFLNKKSLQFMRELLLETELFSQLKHFLLKKNNTETYDSIIQRLQLVELEKGNVLYSQNDFCDNLYVILDGQINMMKMRSYQNIQNTKQEYYNPYIKNLLQNIKQLKVKVMMAQKLFKKKDVSNDYLEQKEREQELRQQEHEQKMKELQQKNELSYQDHVKSPEFKRKISIQYSEMQKQRRAIFNKRLTNANANFRLDVLKEQDENTDIDEKVILDRLYNNLGHVKLEDLKNINKFFDQDGNLKYELYSQNKVGQIVGNEVTNLQEKRQDTALVQRDVKLLVLDRNDYKRFVYDFQKYKINQKVDYLYQYFFLGQEQKQSVLNNFHMFSIKKLQYKGTVFRIGDKVDNVYLIIKGQVEILYDQSMNDLEMEETQDDNIEQLSQKNRKSYKKYQNLNSFRVIQCQNQLFGYDEIINKQSQRVCQAICTTQKVKLYVVSKINFEILLNKFPKYLECLMSNQSLQITNFKNISHNFQLSYQNIQEQNQHILETQKIMSIPPIPSSSQIKTETEILDQPGKRKFQNTFHGLEKQSKDINFRSDELMKSYFNIQNGKKCAKEFQDSVTKLALGSNKDYYEKIFKKRLEKKVNSGRSDISLSCNKTMRNNVQRSMYGILKTKLRGFINSNDMTQYQNSNQGYSQVFATQTGTNNTQSILKQQLITPLLSVNTDNYHFVTEGMMNSQQSYKYNVSNLENMKKHLNLKPLNHKKNNNIDLKGQNYFSIITRFDTN